jgi:hypothetical protein
MTFSVLGSLLLAFAWLGVCQAGDARSELSGGFSTPPNSARPWVYWFWLNGNITREGITADLEAMQRVGIGGVLIMEVDQGTPKGPARFGSPAWRELFKHVCAEADRLGLKVNMNNDAGWCGSGGIWITPELAMQKVTWTETVVEGPRHFEGQLPQPATVAGYYRDIAVLAFPTPAGNAHVPNFNVKAAGSPTGNAIAQPASWSSVPPEQTIARNRLISLGNRLSSDGRLAWDVPPGKWTILRLGHTPTGSVNSPAPVDVRGLECDKLSRAAAEAQFAGLMGKLAADVGPLAGKTLVSTHIDSWEIGVQNWTPRLRQEFQRLRGYDPLYFLPVMTGRVVESMEISERFLWDLRETISELLLDNYAGHFRELAHRHGLRLSIEAYNTCPCDEMAYAGRADEPMGEFWSWNKYGSTFSCTEMASAGHVYGKPIIGAEAFTATDSEKWLGHPGNIKDLGDWAFCEGINRFVFHRYAMQPWPNRRPGMSMGPWGLHYERTQTWWQQSKPWHEYLARCQFLLQQGRFVADLCFLGPEGSPQTLNGQPSFASKTPGEEGQPLERPGHNFDTCPPEVVLTRMSVKDGRLVLPDGMSYRMLVLPRVETMTPRLLGKIKDLVAAGAVVAGTRPAKSPSLNNFPVCDAEVQRLTRELWGAGEPPAEITERTYGKGRLFWGGILQKKSERPSNLPPPIDAAKWIWYPEGHPAVDAPPGRRYFRRLVDVDAKSPLESAQIVLTADNSFTCWINGHWAGTSEDFTQLTATDVTSMLKPGANLVAVLGINGANAPNPAGLIGYLSLKYRDGRIVNVPTDNTWQTALTVKEDWNTDAAAPQQWTRAMELGPLGIAPWGNTWQVQISTQLFPEVADLGRLLDKLGVPPDFSYRARSSTQSLRYIHRTIGDQEVYFVANKTPQTEDAVCSFRVADRRPELWWPETGRIESAAVYDRAGGCMRLPLHLKASESVFVVFRKGAAIEPDRIVSVSRDGQTVLATTPPAKLPSGHATSPIALIRRADARIEAEVRQAGSYVFTTAAGRSRQLSVAELPKQQEIAGPWEVRFPAGGGAPDHVALEKLSSWSAHSDPGVKYFSGTATYQTKFTLPSAWLSHNRRVTLDLGRVQVMAEVKMNGRPLGTLWKAPYDVDISGAAKAGENTLEVAVTNLWVNRLIGDEQLPEDSQRNPDGTLKAWPEWLEAGKPSPTGRSTFTTWRLWTKDSPLVESGLLGPVMLDVSERVPVSALGVAFGR